MSDTIVKVFIAAVLLLLVFIVADYALGGRETLTLEVVDKHYTPAHTVTEATGDKNMPVRTRYVAESHVLVFEYRSEFLERSVSEKTYYATEIGGTAPVTVVTGAFTGHAY